MLLLKSSNHSNSTTHLFRGFHQHTSGCDKSELFCVKPTTRPHWSSQNQSTHNSESAWKSQGFAKSCIAKIMLFQFY
jgi:hypothetical protein